MPTVKFLIQSKKSSAPIYLRLSINRTTSYKRKTGFHINPNDWNQKKGFPKNKIDAKHTEITLSLQKLESFILNEVNNSNSKGIKIDGNWIEEKIDQCFKRNNNKEDKQTVSYVINEIIKNAKSRDNGKGSLGLSKSRIQSYKRLDSLYNEFKGKQNFNIQDLDYKKFNEFKNWLINSKNYAVTYSLKKLSDLKTVCKEAKKIGIPISNEIEGIKTKQGNAYDDDMDVIALSFDEINKIQKLNIQNESLENARKWLIISCFTGQRGETLTTKIKDENFEPYGNGYIIKLTQKKGNKTVTIPVSPEVQKIYENKLPYKVSISKLNKYFKKLGKLASIDEPTLGRIQEVNEKGQMRGVKKIRPKYEYLSTHTGRRSFATNFYGKLNTAEIMKVTGHKKESTFLGYINQSDDSHLNSFFEFFGKKEKNEQKGATLKIIKNIS